VGVGTASGDYATVTRGFVPAVPAISPDSRFWKVAVGCDIAYGLRKARWKTA
jgi:hypothetical protein